MATQANTAPAERPAADEPAGQYFIKPGYRPNLQTLTLDGEDGQRYWTPARIAAARHDFYQFGVYRYAVRVMRRHGLRTLLDVGCGTGHKLEYVHRRAPGARIVGVDQSSAIEHCRREHAFGEWFVDDFEHPDPSLELSGELVLCADVIEHLRDPDRLLAYLRARVAPGGYLILSTPDRDRMRGTRCSHSPNPFHVREWNRRELAEYLEDRGFRVLRQVHHFPVRLRVSRLVYMEVVRRYLQGNSGRYNQVCLLQVR